MIFDSFIVFQINSAWDGQSRFQRRSKKAAQTILQEAVTSSSKVSSFDHQIMAVALMNIWK